MADANATRALLRQRTARSDIYVGTPQQLCAAGLVRPDQFPGQPGRPKVCATYFLADGLPSPYGGGCFEATFHVMRANKAQYSVSVDVCKEETKRREAFLDERYQCPLDIPGTAATTAEQSPAWAPDGWVFRGRRAEVDDYVFVASAEQIRSSGIIEGRPLPAIEDANHKTIRVQSNRFGWVVVSQRAAGTFFVALRAPTEIRYASYEVRDYGHCVCHEGTKAQLQARGLGVGLGFPGEPGCNRRKLKAVDIKTGGEVCIKLLDRQEWCGVVPRFNVQVNRTDEEQEAIKATKRKDEYEKARLKRLKTAPATAHAYRDEVAEMFWTLVNVTKAQMRPKDGYRFTPEVVDEFIDTVTEAYWTIKNGETAGCSPRKKLQQIVAENAKADEPLQRFLASMSGSATK